MRLALVGVGSAGSRIVHRIAATERASGRTLSDENVLFVNSPDTTFDAAARVREDRLLTIGDVHQEVDGRGIDDDPDYGADVAREERHEIVRAFDAIEFHEVDGILVVAGLGGGTGGGAGAVVIDLLTNICDEPVYAVGVLPGASEGRTVALNAARSLQSFVNAADNVVAFDNDAWELPSDATGADYAPANRALAERIVTLFAAGEFAGGATPENLVDPNDVVRTLDTGGLSSIGYASVNVPRTGRVRGLLRWVGGGLRSLSPFGAGDGEDEPATDAAKVNRLIRDAAHSSLTLPCEIESADRVLLILSGPSRALSREGFESGRYWLERETDTVEVMAGDVPHDRSSTLTATVLFSNVTDVPRIDAMQRQAVGVSQPSNGDGATAADETTNADGTTSPGTMHVDTRHHG